MSTTAEAAPGSKKALWIGLGLVVLSGLILFFQMGGSGGAARSSGGGSVYISEDGSDYRPGEPEELHELGTTGEPKQLAHVIRLGGAEQVHYFERVAPAAVNALQQLAGKEGPEAAVARQDILANAAQLRRPGDTGWISANDPRAGSIIAIPDGAEVAIP